MSRSFLITAGTWALLGATIGWAAGAGPDSSSVALDLRSHEVRERGSIPCPAPPAGSGSPSNPRSGPA